MFKLWLVFTEVFNLIDLWCCEKNIPTTELAIYENSVSCLVPVKLCSALASVFTNLLLCCRVWWTRRSHLKWFRETWLAWCACTRVFSWGLLGWSSHEIIFFLVFMPATRPCSSTSSSVGTDGIALSKFLMPYISYFLIKFLLMHKLYWTTCEGGIKVKAFSGCWSDWLNTLFLSLHACDCRRPVVREPTILQKDMWGADTDIACFFWV